MDNEQCEVVDRVMRERLRDARAMAKRAGGFYSMLDDNLDKENEEEREMRRTQFERKKRQENNDDYEEVQEQGE